jgi:hypothetical protein
MQIRHRAGALQIVHQLLKVVRGEKATTPPFL